MFGTSREFCVREFACGRVWVRGEKKKEEEEEKKREERKIARVCDRWVAL